MTTRNFEEAKFEYLVDDKTGLEFDDYYQDERGTSAAVCDEHKRELKIKDSETRHVGICGVRGCRRKAWAIYWLSMFHTKNEK